MRVVVGEGDRDTETERQYWIYRHVPHIVEDVMFRDTRWPQRIVGLVSPLCKCRDR